MSEDIVMRLLRQVKSGEVSLEDARFALEAEQSEATSTYLGVCTYSFITVSTYVWVC